MTQWLVSATIPSMQTYVTGDRFTDQDEWVIFIRSPEPGEQYAQEVARFLRANIFSILPVA